MSEPKSDEQLKFYTSLHKEEDVEKLIVMLKNRYGFICYSFKHNKSYFGIGIYNQSKDSFRALIQPYLYKIKNWHACADKFSGQADKAKPCNSLALPASYSNPVNLKSLIYKENQRKAGIYR